MGMYTGLKVHVKLKPEFIPMIEKIMGVNGAEINYDVLWKNHGYDFTDAWATYWRSSSIPFGSPSTIWDQHDPEWQRSNENGIWKFQTALKNYEDEIDYFLENVLLNITEESYHIEKLYEEYDVGALYEIKDGKLENVRKAYSSYPNDDWSGWAYYGE